MLAMKLRNVVKGETLNIDNKDPQPGAHDALTPARNFGTVIRTANDRLPRRITGKPCA